MSWKKKDKHITPRVGQTLYTGRGSLDATGYPAIDPHAYFRFVSVTEWDGQNWWRLENRENGNVLTLHEYDNAIQYGEIALEETSQKLDFDPNIY